MVPLVVLLPVPEPWEVVFSVGAGDALVGAGTLLLVGVADASLASDASMVSVTVLRIRVKSGEDVRIRGGLVGVVRTWPVAAGSPRDSLARVPHGSLALRSARPADLCWMRGNAVRTSAPTK